jgi:hypothetical protein
MNVSGANLIRSADIPGTRPADFRINQRISAEILNVSGDQVTMVFQGTTVVGKITGGDQALLLADKRSATFIVKGVVDGVLQLQLVRGDGKQTGIESGNQWTILAQNLLRLNGLPITEENVINGRSLLGAGLPITAELLEKLQQALSSIEGWGQAESDLSAAMLANGLPLSSGALNLAMQHTPSMLENIRQLQEKLTSLLSGKTSPELKSLAEKALQLIIGSKVDISGSPTEVVKQLTQAVAIWGKSLESQLADLVKKDKIADKEKIGTGWLVLADLRRALVEHGNTDMVKDVDRFLDSLRQMQFLNTSQTKDPNNPPWLTLNVPLTMGSFSKNQPMDMEKKQAHLKIAYRADEEGNIIDPNNNRIVLTVDLDDGNYLEADLSMVEKRIGAWLTVPSDEWRSLAEEELPTLQEGLEKLGYKVQFARCDIKRNASLIDQPQSAERVDLMA